MIRTSFGIEVRPVEDEDLALSPPVFQNETDGYAELLQYAIWGMLYPEGTDEKPLVFMRNMNPSSWRWSGIVHPGNTILDPQSEAHVSDLAQGDAATTPYEKVCDDPVTYRIESKEPYALFELRKDGGRYVEGKDGCICDLTFTALENSHFEHRNSPRHAVAQMTGIKLSGTYEGRPVQGMGGYDRTWRPKDEDAKKSNETAFAYIAAYLDGEREDGRCEAVYAMISTIDGSNGHGIGLYMLDGEEPVLTDEIYLENAKFVRPDYLPEGDDTVQLVSGDWRFAEKYIHVDYKWGGKGYSATPKFERKGQTQAYGPWYEGNIPYKHKIYYNITEVMGAYVDNIRKMGFEVSDPREK